MVHQSKPWSLAQRSEINNTELQISLKWRYTSMEIHEGAKISRVTVQVLAPLEQSLGNDA